MKKFLTLLLVCMLAFALVACAPADEGTTGPDPEGGEGTATGPAEVRIGLIGPMTGAGAQYGAAMKEAAELAVEEINAAGGINGAEVVLFQEDDASTPAQAVSAAEKLITQDEVHFIVGNYNSSCSLAVMEVTMRESVPHINPISTAAAITESGSQFIFRNCATNPMQVTSVAEYLFATYPEATKYAIICENTDYGIGMREAFEALLPDHPEIEIVASEAYNAGDTDFMAQLTNIQAADPDVLFCASNLTEGSQLYKQADSLGIDAIRFTMGGCSTPDFFELAEGSAVGHYCASYFETSNEDPLVVDFVNAYVEKWGREPDMFAAATYEAIYLCQEAIETAEYVENIAEYRVNLAEALHAMENVPGVQGGPTTFDETGQAEKGVLVVQWNEDGTKTIVQNV